MAVLTMAFSLVLICIISSALALQVTPGSPCASLCLDRKNGNPLDPGASATGPSDIVCSDADYLSSSVGATFRSCMECLQNSTAVSGGESDSAWYIYNLRFAVDVCVFAFPNSSASASSPCALDQTCGPLKNALEIGGLIPGNDTDYQYCDADKGIFATQGGDCAQCLGLSTGSKYLANFVVALYGGCQQRPAPGSLLALSGSVFSTSPISVLSSPGNQTTTAADSSATGMTTGAIVGIVVGAGLALLGAMSLFIVYYRRQSRYKKEDAGLLPPAPKAPGSSDTITSRSIGYYTTDYKPPCPEYEPRDPPSEFSSNAEFYDRMGDAVRRPSDISSDSQPLAMDLGALPTHHAYIPRTMARASRASSPNFNLRPKTNTPLDSYALQQYLHAAEESLAGTLPPPPPNPPPIHSTARSSQPQPPSTRLIKASEGSPPAAPVKARMGSPPLPASVRPQPPVGSPPGASTKSRGGGSPQPRHAFSHVKPPPPPPRAGVSFQALPPPPPLPDRTQTRSTMLPSVPRIKVPKKQPPKIQVQDATPVNDEQGVIDISLPISFSEDRFREHRDQLDLGGRRHTRVSPEPISEGENSETTTVVEHTVDGYKPKQYQEVPIGSGKSILYG